LESRRHGVPASIVGTREYRIVPTSQQHAVKTERTVGRPSELQAYVISGRRSGLGHPPRRRLRRW
jgi:hypothetical protein